MIQYKAFRAKQNKIQNRLLKPSHVLYLNITKQLVKRDTQC